MRRRLFRAGAQYAARVGLHVDTNAENETRSKAIGAVHLIKRHGFNSRYGDYRISKTVRIRKPLCYFKKPLSDMHLCF